MPTGLSEALSFSKRRRTDARHGVWWRSNHRLQRLHRLLPRRLKKLSLGGLAGYERSPGSERGSAVGIHLEVDGDDLLLEASAPPPSAILEVLSQHKAEIVAVLRPGP